ncbi:MAG: DNA-binding protein [Verrucomicrobiaceae bacterium]|nr:DNA-binding protein [Verrucomicrobiaceae bacterium]
MTQNQQIASSLDEVARILGEQGANRFRVQAYVHAADAIRGMGKPVSDILAAGGLEALQEIPGVGETIAHVIQDMLLHGRSGLLERLRGESDPISLLASVPGIGKRTAWKLHEALGIETLQELEIAAHDGRLARLAGIGPKRLAGIRDTLALRLGRLRQPVRNRPVNEPSIAELLDVDRQYREEARADRLKRIAPSRFNPAGDAWLPVLHTTRGTRHYTALFSNSARAHELGRTHDWVVLYYDGDQTERQCTVITSAFGPLQGLRIVCGREAECQEFYRVQTSRD